MNNLPGKSKDETIARTIITLGQGLGMNVIAKDVETEGIERPIYFIGAPANRVIIATNGKLCRYQLINRKYPALKVAEPLHFGVNTF